MTTKMWSCRSSALGACCALAMVVGCDSGPQFHAAQGTVLLAGKPLAGATVMYTPIEAGPIAVGITDSEGRYSLKTLEHEGAVVGQYRVAITKQIMHGFDNSDPTRPNLTPIIEWSTPKKYALPHTSRLTVEVGPSAEEPKFEL